MPRIQALVPKSNESATVAFKVPAALKSRIKEVQDKASAAGFSLAINDVVVSSIEKFLKTAEAELSKVGK
jgi:Tfp pilus assembly PilM family ATPase